MIIINAIKYFTHIISNISITARKIIVIFPRHNKKLKLLQIIVRLEMNISVPNSQHFYVIIQIIFFNHTAILDVGCCGRSFVFNLFICFSLSLDTCQVKVGLTRDDILPTKEKAFLYKQFSCYTIHTTLI